MINTSCKHKSIFYRPTYFLQFDKIIASISLGLIVRLNILSVIIFFLKLDLVSSNVYKFVYHFITKK